MFHLKFSWISGGFAGVDVFFVISGFLITGNINRQLEKREFSLRKFYGRRFRRLFPALAVTILGGMVVGSLIMSPLDLSSFALSAIMSLASLSNFQFWSEAGYFDTAGDLKPLLHTWSLGVEEQFYLVWPLIVIGVWKISRTWLESFLYLFAIGVLSLAAAEIWLGKDPSMVFFLTAFRIFEFAIGALFSWFSKPNSGHAISLEVVGIVGLAMVLMPMFIFSEATVFPGIRALLPCLGAGLVIYAGPRSLVSSLLSKSSLVIVGRISYSLYLVHWPVISLFSYWKLQPLLISEKVVVGILTFVLSYLLYVKVEIPFRSGRYAGTPPRKKERSCFVAGRHCFRICHCT